MSIFLPIWNLDDTTVWTAAGSNAKPQVAWTAADPEGIALTAYQVCLYDTQAHALAYPSSTGRLYDSTKTLGAPGFLNVPYGMKNRDQAGAEVWVVVTVWDDLDEATTSTPVAAKVCWGQAIYQANPGSSSSSWNWDAPAVAGAQVAFIYRSATLTNGGGTVGAWQTSLGAVTPRAFLNVCVRLATYTVGTNAALSSMTFSYAGAAEVPDHWTVDASGDWALDSNVYRHGTRSFKCSVSSNVGDRTAYPFRIASGDDVFVQPDTDYCFSIHVDTLAPLASGSRLVAEVWSAGGVTKLADGHLTDLYDTDVGFTTDSSVASDHWQRIHVHYHTAVGETRVRPILRYVQGGSGTGDIFWVDAAMFSNSRVVPPWEPGFLAAAVVMDSGGIAIDASSGGSFRIRGSTGGATDLVSIGAHGLELSGPLALHEIATPSDTPASGTVYLYAKSDHKIYRKDSTGAETLVN